MILHNIEKGTVTADISDRKFGVCSQHVVRTCWIVWIVHQLDGPFKLEVRVTIRFILAKRFNCADIHCQIISIYGECTISRRVNANWCQQLDTRRMDITDEHHEGSQQPPYSPDLSPCNFLFPVGWKTISVDKNSKTTRRWKQRPSGGYKALKDISMHPETKSWFIVPWNACTFLETTKKSKLTLYVALAVCPMYI